MAASNVQSCPNPNSWRMNPHTSGSSSNNTDQLKQPPISGMDNHSDMNGTWSIPMPLRQQWVSLTDIAQSKIWNLFIHA